MRIKGVIPVRAGSVRVKNKNIRPFAGSTLLEIKISQLKRMPQLDGIIVLSDSPEMLALAESLGCETVKLDDFHASAAATANEVFYNTAKLSNTDIMVHACVTSPTLKDETLENAIKFFLKNMDKYDSINSGKLVKEFLFLDDRPINHSLDQHPKSQNLPNIISRIPAFSIIKKETMMERRSNCGGKMKLLLVDRYEAIDIDEQIDFDFAEFVYKKIKTLACKSKEA
ncbi:MAG: hypothetical protein WA087_01355 [Candidatus Saccharimonadales bacterium]